MKRELDAIVEHGSPEQLVQALADHAVSAGELDAALHLAARLGRVPAMRVLVAAGASVEAATERAGWSPLHTAVEHGQLEAIRELVAQGANVNAKADEGMTPLHLAVDAAADAAEQVGIADGLSVVRLLLELGADPEAPDSSGSTPKDWAEDAHSDELSALLA